MVSVKILQEPDVSGIQPYLTSVQIAQKSALIGEMKLQTPRIKRLVFIALSLLFPIDTVFAVPQQRVTDMGKVRANLVGAAGDQLDFKK